MAKFFNLPLSEQKALIEEYKNKNITSISDVISAYEKDTPEEQQTTASPVLPFSLENLYKSGGKIHIKPSKRGTFTAAAKRHGKSVSAFAAQVLSNPQRYSPAMRKKANFARNARKWHHADGGELIEKILKTPTTQPVMSGVATSAMSFNRDIPRVPSTVGDDLAYTATLLSAPQLVAAPAASASTDILAAAQTGAKAKKFIDTLARSTVGALSTMPYKMNIDLYKRFGLFSNRNKNEKSFGGNIYAEGSEEPVVPEGFQYVPEIQDEIVAAPEIYLTKRWSGNKDYYKQMAQDIISGNDSLVNRENYQDIYFSGRKRAGKKLKKEIAKVDKAKRRIKQDSSGQKNSIEKM